MHVLTWGFFGMRTTNRNPDLGVWWKITLGTQRCLPTINFIASNKDYFSTGEKRQCRKCLYTRSQEIADHIHESLLLVGQHLSMFRLDSFVIACIVGPNLLYCTSVILTARLWSDWFAVDSSINGEILPGIPVLFSTGYQGESPHWLAVTTNMAESTVFS